MNFRHPSSIIKLVQFGKLRVSTTRKNLHGQRVASLTSQLPVMDKSYLGAGEEAGPGPAEQNQDENQPRGEQGWGTGRVVVGKGKTKDAQTQTQEGRD